MWVSQQGTWVFTPQTPYEKYLVRTAKGKATLARMQERVNNIQAIYDSGTPLYTRDALRYYADQLGAFNHGATVTLRHTGIDGKVVVDHKPLALPETTCSPDSDLEESEYIWYLYPCHAPRLDYSLTIWVQL